MVNPNRIRQARELAHLTQTQLAEAIGVNQSAIAHFEGGRTEPSEEYLEAIAHHLGFPVSFFHRDDPPNFPSGSLLFRAHAKIQASDRDSAYRFGELEFEAIANLIKEVRIKSVFKLPQLNDGRSEETKLAQYAAQLTRNAFGISQNVPIHNLMKLVEQSDIVVLALPIAIKDCDAFSQWVSMDASKSAVRAKKPFIVVTGGVPGDRLRYSVAHEMGHLIMHQSMSGRSREIEDEANDFASEFLMPEVAMRQQITKPVTLYSLAKLKPIWGVSIQALIMRARDLEIINPRQVSNLYKQLNSEDWRKEEPISIPIEKPRALRRMAEALYGNPINYQKLAQDLDWNPIRVKQILEAYATKEEFSPTTTVSQEVKPTNITQFRPKRRNMIGNLPDQSVFTN